LLYLEKKVKTDSLTPESHFSIKPNTMGCELGRIAAQQ